MTDATARSALRAARRRLLPRPGRALLHDAARRPRRGRDQGGVARRRRHALLDAAGHRGRRLDLLPGDQPEQAVGRARPQGRRRPRARAGARPPRGRVRAELQAGRADQVRPRLRRGQRAQPVGHLRLDQRLRQRRRQGPARLRPHGPGDVRAHVAHRRPGRPAVPRGHLGVRRDRRPAHHDRDPRRAQPQERDRRGPAPRRVADGVGDVRHGEPDERLRGGRGGAVPYGQLAPEPVPLRAAAHRRRRPDRHGRQRRAVPQAVRRDRRA